MSDIDELIAAATSSKDNDYPPELIAFVKDCGIKDGLDDVPFSDIWDMYNKYTASPINKLSLGNFLSNKFNRYQKGRRTIYMLDRTTLIMPNALTQSITSQGQADEGQEEKKD